MTEASSPGQILERAARTIRWENATLFLVVVIGTFARLHQIDYNFDGDEIFSVTLASGSLSEVIVRSLQDTPHPPLYNVLLFAWTRLFGITEVSTRSLSVLFSVGFLFFAFKASRQYMSAWLSLGVALLCALSPYFVYFGQQARPYALIAFLSSVNFYAFLKFLAAPNERVRSRSWLLSSILLIYSQYIAVVFIACQTAFALIRLRSTRTLVFAIGAASTASIVPWMILAMGRAAFLHADPLPQVDWLARPQLVDLVWFFASLFGTVLPVHWLFLLFFLLTCAYGARFVSSKQMPANHWLLLVIAIAMPALIFVLSIWGPKPVFVSRQLEYAALAFLILIGLSLARIPRLFAATAICSLVIWCAISLPSAEPSNIKPPLREIAHWIDNRFGSRPLVGEEPLFQQYVAYYRQNKTYQTRAIDDKTFVGRDFLFLCRPYRCAAIESSALRKHAKFLRTWHWNTYSGFTPYNQLNLYEILQLQATRVDSPRAASR